MSCPSLLDEFLSNLNASLNKQRNTLHFVCSQKLHTADHRSMHAVNLEAHLSQTNECFGESCAQI
jgi:hypothetical protein